MKIFPVAFFVLISSISVGHAGELYIYEHNGSVMDVFYSGDTISISYSNPRAGLKQAGVKSGDFAFKGFVEGQRYSGTAFAFKVGCVPAPYEVIGEKDDFDTITLKGPAPVRKKSGCAVLRYSLSSPHAILRFRYSSTHH